MITIFVVYYRKYIHYLNNCYHFRAAIYFIANYTERKLIIRQTIVHPINITYGKISFVDILTTDVGDNISKLRGCRNSFPLS